MLFGKNVKILTLLNLGCDFDVRSESLRTFKRIIALCPNLIELHLEDIHFKKEDYDTLKNLTTNIKQLTLKRCNGITDDWSDSLKTLTNLEKFTMTDPCNTTANFYKNFKNLSSLSIGYYSYVDLETIFDTIGYSLQHLKLNNISVSSNVRHIGRLITDKLPKLDRLEISTDLRDNLTELPHLKSLELHCWHAVHFANPILHILSENEVIENLFINLKFQFEDRKDMTLICNELLSFELLF